MQRWSTCPEPAVARAQARDSTFVGRLNYHRRARLGRSQWRRRALAPVFCGEMAMPKKLRLSLSAAALLCSTLPARGEELPDGKGKEMVAASCTSCHTFSSRVGAGYTAKGW